MNKIIQPKHVLIEKIAGELAACWYEIGRSQGLTSKCKNARQFARKNLEKFIPMAVQTCLEMLGPHSNVSEIEKFEIYEALMERHDDPELCSVLPNIDVKKIIEYQIMIEKSKIINLN